MTTSIVKRRTNPVNLKTRDALLAAIALVAMSALPVSAQPAPAQMPGMPTPGAATPNMPMNHAMPGIKMSQDQADSMPSSKAFKAADDKMMQGMMAPKTGESDQDFVASMIPHHQGAIDMAKVELQYGKDPVLRKLAEGIIKAQEKEIAEMKSWQNRHPLTR